MSETVTLTREELQQIIRQEVAQQTRHGSASTGDALMDEVAQQPPRCSPIKDARQEMAAQAELRGGVWHPEYADIRKYKKCGHAHPTQCDRCWTAETEARWAFALGLSETEPIPLDQPEAFGEGNANVERRDTFDKRHGRTAHRRVE